MMRGFWIMLLMLAGCNAPTRYFGGMPASRITVDGSTFDVRVRGDLAEAIRINPQYAPRFGPIRARAAFAMAQASGCRVLNVTGDQALALGQLACNGRLPTWIAPVYPVSYSCLELSQWADDGPGRAFVDYDCDPY